MSELPRTDDPPLEAERIEEAFAAFADRVRELDAVANDLRAELRALRAERDAPPALDDEEEWPADAGASPVRPAPVPPAHWIAAVPPPLTRTSAAPRLVAEVAFLLAVALLAGLADLSATWIALVMVLAWALVALSEWAAAAKRSRWRLDEVAPALASPAGAELDTTGPWDIPVVQATALERPDESESRTVVAKLPPAAEEAEEDEEDEEDEEAASAKAEGAGGTDDAEQTIAPSSTGGRRLRFWRRTPVESTPDPWEA